MTPQIDLIKSCGYRVFIRPGKTPPTYCFFTDGTRIAYAQWEMFRQSISTVHKANKQTGTGFQFSQTIDAGALAGALACHAPSWATESDRKSVVKYADWDAYHNASAWNRELTEV